MILCVLAMLVAAMVMSGVIALAARAVRLPTAAQTQRPKLVALISAIGASFVLAELMGLRDKIAKFVGLEVDAEQLRRPRA